MISKRVSMRKGHLLLRLKVLTQFILPFPTGNLMKKTNVEILSAAAKESKTTNKTVSIKSHVKTLSAKTSTKAASEKCKEENEVANSSG